MAEREVDQWITVNGKHIPIYKGESKQDAINRAIAKRNEDNKDKQIANNKKQSDELNKKTLMQRNAEALGIDYEKNAEKLVKDYNDKLQEYAKTPVSQVDKRAELTRWIKSHRNAYHEAEVVMKVKEGEPFTKRYKSYAIDFNTYGQKEFSVQYGGDDHMFKSFAEAMAFIDKLD